MLKRSLLAQYQLRVGGYYETGPKKGLKIGGEGLLIGPPPHRPSPVWQFRMNPGTSALLLVDFQIGFIFKT